MGRTRNNEWLVGTTKSGRKADARKATTDKTKKASKDQWLAVPGAEAKRGRGSNGAATESVRSPSVARSKRQSASRRQAERRINRRDQRIAALEGRIDELTQELKDARELDKALRAELAASKSTRRIGAAKRSGSRSDLATQDLNRVTFEELRELGLSVTLSARLIAARELRGSFHSIDALDELSGFSREAKAQLKEQLVVNGAPSGRAKTKRSPH